MRTEHCLEIRNSKSNISLKFKKYFALIENNISLELKTHYFFSVFEF